MATVSLRGLHKTFGDTPILRGLDLELAEGEFAVLVGPSGCGKSTLLRCLAGLETPEQGSVWIDGREVTHAPPRDRGLGMVFQSYALYPHLSVRANIAFGLELRGEAPAKIAASVERAATMLGLVPLLDRLPKQLSGGQRQRVAMARALAREPGLLLFDEPLSNLDAALRTQVRVEIKKLHAELGATMVYVTHDQVEAMTLADRLVVLHKGRVEQQGPPLEVYKRPGSRFVAGFLGSPAMNFAELARGAEGWRAPGLRLDAHPRLPRNEQTKLTVGVRPHDLHPARDADALRLELRVEVVEAMGFESYAYGTLAGETFVARVDASAGPLPKRGDTLALGASEEEVHLFDAETGRALAESSAV